MTRRVHDAALSVGEQDHVARARDGARRVVQHLAPRLPQVLAAQDLLDLVGRDPLGGALHEGVDRELAALAPAMGDRGARRGAAQLAGLDEPRPGGSDFPDGAHGIRRDGESRHRTRHGVHHWIAGASTWRATAKGWDTRGLPADVVSEDRWNIAVRLLSAANTKESLSTCQGDDRSEPATSAEPPVTARRGGASREPPARARAR